MPERLDQLTAAILVGGLGTRLRPILPDRPKVLAPVGGRPFLFRLLDQLADAGLKRVVLCTGHQGGEIEAAVGERYREVRIEYSRETEPLGTAGALRQLNFDPLLVMNGDSFCELDLPAFWKSHRTAGTLVVARVADTQGRGCVEFDVSGRITRFAEKAGRGAGWINAGIYLLGREILESIPVGRFVSIEREIFPAWVCRGLCAFKSGGRFLDIGTPESYAAGQSFFP